MTGRPTQMDGRRILGMWRRYKRGDLLAVIGIHYGIGATAVHNALKRAGYVLDRPRGQKPRFQTPSGRPVEIGCLVWKPNAQREIPKPPPRAWCIQCERNVCTAEADQCSSPWCRAKVTA